MTEKQVPALKKTPGLRLMSPAQCEEWKQGQWRRFAISTALFSGRPLTKELQVGKGHPCKLLLARQRQQTRQWLTDHLLEELGSAAAFGARNMTPWLINIGGRRPVGSGSFCVRRQAELEKFRQWFRGHSTRGANTAVRKRLDLACIWAEKVRGISCPRRHPCAGDATKRRQLGFSWPDLGSGR